MKLQKAIDEVKKLKNELPTGFCNYKLYERDGEIKYLDVELRFKVDGDVLTPLTGEGK